MYVKPRHNYVRPKGILQVEVNPGSTNKILFVCLTAKENHGSGAIVFEGQDSAASFLVKF